MTLEEFLKEDERLKELRDDAISEANEQYEQERQNLFEQIDDSKIGDILVLKQFQPDDRTSSGDTAILIINERLKYNGCIVCDYIPLRGMSVKTIDRSLIKEARTLGHIDFPDASKEFIKAHYY